MWLGPQRLTPLQSNTAERFMAAKQLKCREGATEYPLEARYLCSRWFGPLGGSYEHARPGGVGEGRRRVPGRPRKLRRYHDVLPCAGPQPRTRTGLPAGCTPLIRADRLARRLGLREVWVKNDTANPTHSFKDRVVSVAAMRARELGFDTLA